jgi:hypothetical protein
VGHRDPGFSSAGRAEGLSPFDEVAVSTQQRRRKKFELPGLKEPPLRLDINGHSLGPVDEVSLRDVMVVPVGEVDLLPPAYRGESYGTNQLHMSWEEKEVSWHVIRI